MSIIAKCECGHRMSVADVMAGKSVRCSKCTGLIEVPEATGPKGPSPMARRNAEVPSVSVSPALVMTGIVTAVVMAIVLTFYFGPWTVGKKWEAMSVKANEQVTDVVQFALQAYESEHALYDTTQSHNLPQLQGDASFVPPMMAFSLPRKIIFLGKTNRGNYTGTFDTTNGEVEAEIETGGFTVAGLLDVKKATGKFRITGRMKDGEAEAECDGEPLKIVAHKPEE
jgi:hypothetical protein